MSGKPAVLFIIVSAILAGIGIWYLQVFAYYKQLDAAAGAAEIQVVRKDGSVKRLGASDFTGIDANSSPMRYRSCFRVDPADFVGAQYVDKPTPLIGPGWFECYSAERLTHDLESGVAHAYLMQSEIHPNVDRIMSVYSDGRAYAWHQFNDKTPERSALD